MCDATERNEIRNEEEKYTTSKKNEKMHDESDDSKESIAQKSARTLFSTSRLRRSC